MPTTQKIQPPHVRQLVLEAGSSDPAISASARSALAEMGKKGGKATAKRRRQAELELKVAAEAYRRASRGW